MRRRLLVLLSAALLAPAAQASPTPLVGAALTFQLGSDRISVDLPWSGTGSATLGYDGLGRISTVSGLTPGIFATGAAFPVTDPVVYPIGGLAFGSAATFNGKVSGVASTGAGDFGALETSSGGGTMALGGLVGVCLFTKTGCSAAVANLVVPFTAGPGVNGVGLGGAPIPLAQKGLSVTVFGAPWTTGTATVGSSSMSGAPSTPTRVTLVTPAVVSTSISFDVAPVAFLRLVLDFAPAPEPGTLLLTASGVVLLSLFTGRRERSPRLGAARGKGASMRARFLVPIVSLSMFSAAAQAAPTPLVSASLGVSIAALPPVQYVWNGTGSADLVYDGAGRIASISNLTPGIFSRSGTIPITDPRVFPIVGLALGGGATSAGRVGGVASNGAGGFAGVDTSAGGGTMGLTGVVGVCLFSTACGAPGGQNMIVPFTAGPGTRGVGLGGASVVAKGAVNLSVSGNPWTTGVATAYTVTQSGVASTATSVILVTPATISSAIGGSALVPVFGVLTLEFAPVPEPGTALLVGASLGALSLALRRRARG